MSDNNIKNSIQSMYNELSTPQIRNFKRWQILDSNSETASLDYSKIYLEEIKKLENWLIKRANWLDNNINILLTFPPELFKS